MSGRRARLVILLVLFHVGLAAAATVLSIDVASAPSYFDDSDGDFLPRLLAEQMPAVLDPAADWGPVLILLAAVAACASRPGSPVAAAAEHVVHCHAGPEHALDRVAIGEGRLEDD